MVAAGSLTTLPQQIQPLYTALIDAPETAPRDMSQENKPDIASFFRPHAKPIIPRKRPMPDRHGDVPVTDWDANLPATPSTQRILKHGTTSSAGRTPSHSAVRPLATPKSGRCVSIPIRSPAGATPKELSTVKHAPLFEPTQAPTASSPLPHQSSSFSFPDAPTSSRSVMEDGKLVAVRDSDDSDDSLQSLSEMLCSKKKKVGSTQHSSQTDPSTNEDERRRMLSLFTGGRSEAIIKKKKFHDIQKRDQTDRFDISHIFEDEKKDAESRARIAAADAEIEAGAQELEASKRAALDRKLLASILRGGSAEDLDDKGMEKLLGAVDRTEALAGDKSFAFFGPNGPRELSNMKNIKKIKFPASSIPASLWKSSDDSARDRTYLCGFMSELAEIGKLDDNAIRWTFDTALVEPRDDLRHVYVNCVRASSAWWTRANLTPTDVYGAFDRLGADTDLLRDNTEVEISRQPRREARRWDCSQLLIALRLFHVTCQDMDFTTLSKLVAIVSRLTLDLQLMSNNLVSHAVKSMLSKLANLPELESRQHVHDRLLSDLGSNLTESTLQAQFLEFFIPTTSAAATLHSHLAAIFLLGPATAEKYIAAIDPIKSWNLLKKYLKAAPLFRQKNNQDDSFEDPASYQTLTCLTHILDATIADGNSPPTFLNRAEENAFNEHVDDVAKHIHGLFASITDSGASHMRRTEAKDALQALNHRLVHGVRTRPKRKRHVFDAIEGLDATKEKSRARIVNVDEMEGNVRSRNFMDKFLLKRRGLQSSEGSVAEEQEIFVDVLEA